MALACAAAPGFSQIAAPPGVAAKETALRRERDVVREWARRIGLPLSIKVPGGRATLETGRPGRPRWFGPAGVESAVTTGASLLWPGGASGLGLTGAGSVSAIFDFGSADATHPELAGRLVDLTGAGTSAHATQIAGLIAAIGTGTGTARNSAYGSTVRVYDSSQFAGVSADLAGLGVSASNHSYMSTAGWTENPYGDGYWMWMGDPELSQDEDAAFGYYNNVSTFYDELFHLTPNVLSVVAAGNARGIGPEPGTEHYAYDAAVDDYLITDYTRPRAGGLTGHDTLPPGPQTAKNGLVVGACQPIANGYRLPTDIVPWATSSIGPTDDGRIKPDLLAPGVGVWALSPGGGYGFVEGTSFAAPQAVGASALLAERFRRSGWPNPSAALQKALFIHSARPATADGSPTYATGWGLLDVREAVELVEVQANGGGIFENATLAAGATRSVDVFSDGTTPLKVTIAWLDPAGFSPAELLDSQTRMLVNDLDVRVEGAGGPHLPWRLNPLVPTAAATRGDNDRDNVEVVSIPAPTPGTYRIVISCKNGAAQNYAIVATGARSLRPSGVTLSRSSVASGDGTALSATVSLNGPAPAGGTAVRLSSSSTFLTAPATVTVPAGSTSASVVLGHTSAPSDRDATLTARFGDGRAEGTVRLLMPIRTAEFVSQSVPTTWWGGVWTPATVTMRNTGNVTWTRAGGFRLGSHGPTDNLTWGMNRVNLANEDAILPGQTKTFTWNVTPPTITGTANFAWRMVQDGVAWFGDASPSVTVNLVSRENDSVFVSQTVPDAGVKGMPFSFSITLRNVGRNSWTEGTSFRLGSVNDNAAWGSTRVLLGAGESIPTGASKTFTFTRTAPNGSSAVSQWRMVREGVAWFGESTPAVTVALSPKANDCTITGVNVPTSVSAGGSFTASITVRNDGTTTWTAASLHRLGDDLRRWGRTRWSLDAGDSIAPGASKTFTGTFTAPTTPGTYAFSWRMLQENVEWFGPSGGASVVVN